MPSRPPAHVPLLRRPARGGRIASALALALVLLTCPQGDARAATSTGTSPQVTASSDSVPDHPGEALQVSLLTAEPGTAVWERFGHNAIRIRNTLTGRDVAYNWGIFDFQQEDFIPRFLRGDMLYMMAAFPTAPMLDSYLSAGRRVMVQELALTPEERWTLLTALEENARPENREYYYDYFLDNCSTRARDALDRVLGGVLAARFQDVSTGTSYRFHTRRLTRMDPLIYPGMDFLLGSPGDQPITVWEEMFLPMTLMEAVRTVQVEGPAGPRPLVLRESVLDPSSPEETAGERPWGPEEPPSRGWLYLVLGLAVGGLLVRLGQRAVRGSTPGALGASALILLWSLVAGLLGTILILVLFTDHQFMAWNENLFLMNPLSLGLVVLGPLALLARRGERQARALAWMVVGVAVIGLVVQPLPSFHQENAMFFALVLPVHLAVAWVLQQRASPRAG